MKNEFLYIKRKPFAFASLIVLAVLYLFMIFAEFISPYTPTKTFEENTFHPANITLTLHGFKVREARVLNRINWDYAYVKGVNHKLKFFVHGESYKLLGFIKTDIHLFGTEPDKDGNVYPVYLCGADNLGRDMFTRMVYGSRISLTIGFVATAVSLVLAVILGGLAGFFGGKTDWLVMRGAEFFMLIPSLYLILFLRSLLNTKMDSGTSYMVITLILALVGWPGSARTFRGMIHAIKREEFVMNASLEGIPSLVIIFKYIIPQITSLLIVSTTLSIPGFIMSETTLSYIGLGISDPAVSWGSMINREVSTLSNLARFPWLLNPVWLLLLVTLAFNFIGDALRDYYDPYHAVFPSFKKYFSKSDAARPVDKSVILSMQDVKVDFYVQTLKGLNIINAVKGISYDLKYGEILGIVGESGSGKSVSTTAIPGLLPGNAVISGHIMYEGIDLLSLSQKQLSDYRGKKIALIFQEPGRSFDPLQNIGNVFLEVYRNMNPDITKEEAMAKAEKQLEEVGLPDPKSRLLNFPHQFSGGQLQRIGIALALAQGCKVLIADEPTTALDVTISMQITGLLTELKKKHNLSILFISHDIDLVANICDRIIVMHNGIIEEQSTPEELFNNPKSDYAKHLISTRVKFGQHYTDSDGGNV
ncbi:MAG: dipeptide/oligopeptide/nickel ABC transporter permease/ATP-binding protein [Treponema sp.]|uniref:dipeptide/oligopeptide/nickel ABC transporter permease/ATP-binding protein n=1 Tax=Treponema sp. TaxID=166 RepID=UPI00298DEECA|nr:dipeptide/oligopeptide/nickel ABC transporter permease/ATP-binding protein [Treponema sp.]MBR5934127.1 dipeptide/oligopeptide/nickel ABC transporter permease/ATP-binding protein [Treponema sp.]